MPEVPRPGEQSQLRLRSLFFLRRALSPPRRACRLSPPGAREGGALLGAWALVLLPAACGAWGARTHEIVNRRAAELVPEPARAAWSILAPSLGAHSNDADRRKRSRRDEASRHYIDIDVYDSPPFNLVPRDFEELVRRRGRAEAERWGRLPWAIDECYRMLVLSLRRGEWGSAGAWAADLGHYVADAHQPLHGTRNFDGQRTGNRGVHLRFEVFMMDRHLREGAIQEPLPEPIREVDPAALAIGWIAEAYPGIAQILRGDDAAREADPAYGERYYDLLWEETGELALRQVERAISHLAALYAAAWEEAGRPAPPEASPVFRALPAEVLDPSRAASPRSPRRALLVAGAALLGAVLFGAF